MKIFLVLFSTFYLITTQSDALKWAETLDHYYIISNQNEDGCESCGNEDSDTSQLLILNKSTNAEQRLLIGKLDKRVDPSAIAVKDRKAYIVFRQSGSLAIINLDSLTIENTVTTELGREPIDIRIIDTTAYISDADGNLILFDLETQKRKHVIENVPTTLQLAQHQGNLYGISYRQGLFTFDKTTQTLKSLVKGSKLDNLLFHDHFALYLQNGRPGQIDLETGHVTESPQIPLKLTNLFIDQDQGIAIGTDQSIYEVNLSTLNITRKVALPVANTDDDSSYSSSESDDDNDGSGEGSGNGYINYQLKTFYVKDGIGYIHRNSNIGRFNICTVIDLSTYRIIGSTQVTNESKERMLNEDGTLGKVISTTYTAPDFYTSTHAYHNGNRLFPLYPTKSIISQPSLASYFDDLLSLRKDYFKVTLSGAQPALTTEDRSLCIQLQAIPSLCIDLILDFITDDLKVFEILSKFKKHLSDLTITHDYFQNSAQWPLKRKALLLSLYQKIWLGERDFSKSIIGLMLRMNDPFLTESLNHFRKRAFQKPRTNMGNLNKTTSN